MINGNFIKSRNFTPGKAAAVAVFADLYLKKPNVLKALLQRHEQNFTGDPNIDFFQVAQLLKDKGNFFNKDLDQTFTDAKYFSLKDLGSQIKDTFHDASVSISNAGQQVAPIAGTLFTMLSPAIGAAANSAAPGSGAAATGLSQGLGAALMGAGAPKTEPSAQLPAPVQQAIQTTFAQNQNSNLDDRPGSSQILDLIKNMLPTKPEEETNKDKILGMAKKTFYIVIFSVIGAILLVIAIIIIVKRNKKKKLEAAKK